ncbi:MAG: right-handed parallel beta-helix repeat-containing protein [Bacteroidota bacterium]
MFFFAACHTKHNIIKIKGSKQKFSSIQQAVDSAKNGSTLIINPGKYEISEQLWIVKDSFTVKGKGKVEILCTDMKWNVIWIGGNHITIKKIYARHIKPEFYAECMGSVIYVDMGENTHIENCDLNGCGRVGVNISGGLNIILKNNYIHDNTECAVRILGNNYYSATDEFPDVVRFINNIFNNNGEGRE